MKLIIDGVEVKLTNPGNGIHIVISPEGGEETIGPVRIELDGKLVIVGNEEHHNAVFFKGPEGNQPYLVLRAFDGYAISSGKETVT